MQLRLVTVANFRDVLDLCVTEQQESFVGTTAEAIAHAHFYPVETPRVICNDDGVHVGFAMYRLDGSIFHLSRFLIDCGYQRRGYGGRALDALIALARTQQCTAVELAVHCEADAAIALYRSRGFDLVEMASNHLRGVLALV